MHPIIPLLILILFLIIAAVIGFVVYSIATDIASKTSKKMDDHNITFGKDGLKIGVKEMKHEDYVGRTQDVLVKAWNLSTWPAYKSRFWNKGEEGKKGKGSPKIASSNGKSLRPGASPRVSSNGSPKVSGSSTPRASGSSSPMVGSSSASHTHHAHRENGRLAEPRPAVHRTTSGHVIPGSFD